MHDIVTPNSRVCKRIREGVRRGHSQLDKSDVGLTAKRQLTRQLIRQAIAAQVEEEEIQEQIRIALRFGLAAIEESEILPETIGRQDSHISS